MSRIGNPYDNAKRRVHETLKHEEVDGRDYRDLSQARDAIGAFIEDVYNRRRLHSALAYRRRPSSKQPATAAAAARRPQAVANATCS